MISHVNNSRCAARIYAIMVLCVILFCAVMSPVEAAPAEDFPYPDLLEYEDLDESFEKLAKDKILPEYREYVLAAIKYHIEAKRTVDYNSTDYRAAKNLMKAFNAKADGNLVFFFDGCSINLQNSTPCFSGFLKNGNRYNESAVCIVVRVNERKHPEIMFASANGSTTPDNLRYKKDNNGINESITADGVYGITAVNHMGHILNLSAMDIAITGYGSVRMPDLDDSTGGTYYDNATGIHLHSRYKEELYDPGVKDYANSTGCFNVGRTKNDEEYRAFMKATTGIEDPESDEGHFSSKKTTPYGYSLGSDLGIIIVDHSNYKEQLAIVVGDDNPKAPNHKTGEEIVGMITRRSDSWHEDILQYIEEHRTEPEGTNDVIFMIDGSSSMSKTAFEMMKDTAKAIVDEALNSGTEARFAILPFGRTFDIRKLNGSDDGFYENREDIMAAISGAQMSKGCTFLADALQYVEQVMDGRNSSKKTVILMTDGNANSIRDGMTKKYGIDGPYNMEINAFYQTAHHLAKDKDYCFITMGVRLSRFPKGGELLAELAESSGGCYQALTSAEDADLKFTGMLAVKES